jgi:hypothetical protein
MPENTGTASLSRSQNEAATSATSTWTIQFMIPSHPQPPFHLHIPSWPLSPFRLVHTSPLPPLSAACPLRQPPAPSVSRQEELRRQPPHEPVAASRPPKTLHPALSCIRRSPLTMAGRRLASMPPAQSTLCRVRTAPCHVPWLRPRADLVLRRHALHTRRMARPRTRPERVGD